MSQQLNLLKAESRALSPAAIALVIWGVIIGLLAAFWSVNLFRINATKESVAQVSAELEDAKRVIKERTSIKEKLESEIAALTPAANAAQLILNQAAELGTWTGYSAQFDALAQGVEPGLWLTELAVEKSGKKIKVSGASLSNEAVLRYSRSLNASFEQQGLAFTSIEMTPLTVEAKDGKPAMTATKFTIH